MRLLQWTVLLLLVLVPPVIFFTLGLIQPRYFACGLIILFIIRVIPACRQADHYRVFMLWSLAMIAALTGIALSDNITALLLYPVIMNGGFLALFAFSLLYPPSMIEQIARIHDPELPEPGIRYTRKVTMVWCVFFLLNGSVAGWTVWKGDSHLWGLYNGFISYIIMGLLMLAEYWVRCSVRQAIENE